MKAITILSLLAAGAAAAGEKSPILDKAPIAPSPDLYSWFAGATVGYLTENDTEMYTAHLGIDLPNKLGRWDQAIYLEVGYAELDEHLTVDPQNDDYYYYYYGDNKDPQVATIRAKPRDGADALRSIYYDHGYLNIDLQFIPVTLNYKLEKAISPSLNAYLGLGAGAAFIDADVSAGGTSDSDDDAVFFAQAFAGVLYNVSPTFEIFAGARVLYFDDPEFKLFGTTVDLKDFEAVGYDVETTDALLELGGRVNF